MAVTVWEADNIDGFSKKEASSHADTEKLHATHRAAPESFSDEADHVEHQSLFKKMDRLDRIALLGILLVTVVVGGLFAAHQGDGDERPVYSSRQAAPQTVSPELEKKMAVARELLLAGNFEKAEGLLKSLVEQFPYEGHVYMLMGDFFIHAQKPILAMLEHRKAIELNPDFLDKKTKDFQGKKIKNNAAEARMKIEEGQNLDPQGEKWREYRKELYYMQRRIAGSCG